MAASVLVTEQALANTYSPNGYPNGWAAVEAYRTWQTWQSHNPDAGRTAGATALEMPEGRIRVWQDGGRPDPVTAIEKAQCRNWIAVTPTSPSGEHSSACSPGCTATGPSSTTTRIPLPGSS